MSKAGLELAAGATTVQPTGRWTLATLTPEFRARLQESRGGVTVVDCSRLDGLDTAGALALHSFSAEVTGLRREFRALYDQVAELHGRPATKPPSRPGFLYRTGMVATTALDELQRYLAFVGEMAVAAFAVARQPRRFRWKPLLGIFETAGWQALPILGLLSFLIGIVIAYQAGVQLRDFGANIFIADLIGVAVLRELGPLIAAIIVAGRTGSAFTAQIGTMKVTEEIDALRTIGVSPQEILVLPKVIALALVLPLLTVFASIFGTLGGVVMAQQMLDVGIHDFWDRFLIAVDLSDYLTGIGKAPVFALLIASVGCFQGFEVGNSADSVGQHVTRSVVQAIFLIIVADAAFSVVFNMLGL
jgi:phospholipid/cholesterol/gamma-HCH transport system permease protein